MGNLFKLESKPEIRGESQTISSEDEVTYFSRINNLLRNSYVKNMYNDDNLSKSLELKSFNTVSAHPQVEDITWLEYITNYIEDTMYKNHFSWCSELLFFIKEQSFISESKYDSTFFYNEYLIKTIPNSLYDEKDIDNEENIIEVDKVDVGYNSKQPINLEELDITANLGGSYLDLNTDDLLPDDPTIQYLKRRKLLKKYIRIFKEHIYKNADHPIMAIIIEFNRIFSKYITTNLKNFENQLRKNEITADEYNKNLSKFEKEITTNLQNFIIRMHCTVKLFYSTVIDYAAFQDEKEDLLNMLITLFFKTGNLYEAILELYNLAFSKEVQDMQDKLVNLKNIKPKNLDVKIKFCLDDDTLELQKKILKEKREEKDKKEGEEQSKEPEKNNLQIITENKRHNSLELRDKEEKEDKEKEDDNENTPIIIGISQIKKTNN